MTNKILKSILSVAVAVLLASLLVITGVLYGYFSGIQQKQLKDELTLAAGATEQLGKDYLVGLPADHYRLTWIAADGSVLFDSRADPAAMENHADREEIREAQATGSGSSARRSPTLTEQTLYEAVRLEDGSVLRISVSRATAAAVVLDMLQPIALIAILAAVLSAWIARRMARRVTDPLNRLDLEHPLDNDAYEELSPLLHRIHAQQLDIRRQLGTLRRQQEEFDQITGSMKEALVLLDRQGKIVSINPAARTLFGADAFCVGRDFLTIDRKQNMRLAIRDARQSGHSALRAPLNGREYQFDLSRIEADGSVRGLVILAFDVTEQVNAEHDRREFTANVSHELKTPLQSIIGSAELLENGIVKAEDVPCFISRIRQEAARLVSLIDDIIRLSQLDEGGDMPHEDVSLRVLSEEVCQTLSDAAKTKEVSLSVTGDDGVVRGVHRLLFEVIYNLCDNAIQYNHPGGQVNIKIEDREDTVCLRVQDNGIGIAPEHQGKIFERFYRVDKSHSKRSGGTGLGLSIVKHAVQYHHGTIELQSQVGKGTTVSVLLERSK